MKTIVFSVPKKLIREFAGKMDEHDLDNRIQGVDDDGDIEIAVEYEPNQKSIIEEIDEMIDEYNNDSEEN